MKTETKLPIILTLLCVLSGCLGHTKYRPSIHGHDYLRQEIIEPTTHRRIYTGDAEFNKFVSISLDDLAKLALVLKNAKLPRKVRRIVERFSKEVKTVEKKNKQLLSE